MAEAARVYKYERYNYGSAAPAREAFPELSPRPGAVPIPNEHTRARERARAAAAAQSAPFVSLFGIFGSIFVAVLMIFVILAQISYIEAAGETVRLNAQLSSLTQQQRVLEISFERVICIQEIEQYAKDVLGMSAPEPDQIAFIRTAPSDRAEVIECTEENALDGLGAFISSLIDYFR